MPSSEPELESATIVDAEQTPHSSSEDLQLPIIAVPGGDVLSGADVFHVHDPRTGNIQYATSYTRLRELLRIYLAATNSTIGDQRSDGGRFLRWLAISDGEAVAKLAQNAFFRFALDASQADPHQGLLVPTSSTFGSSQTSFYQPHQCIICHATALTSFKDVVEVQGNKQNLDEKECGICLEMFVSTSVVRVLPCDHLFHAQCVDRWLLESPYCPCCRKRLVPMPSEIYHAALDQSFDI